jgi:hypothetical protein
MPNEIAPWEMNYNSGSLPPTAWNLVPQKKPGVPDLSNLSDAQLLDMHKGLPPGFVLDKAAAGGGADLPDAPWLKYQTGAPGGAAKDLPDAPWLKYADPAKMTDTELKAAHAALPPGFQVDNPNVAADVVKSGAAGVGKGVAGMIGAPQDLANLGQRAVGWIANKFGVPQETIDRAQGVASEMRASGALPSYPTAASTQRAMENITGTFHKPETTAGHYFETMGEFAPGLIGGGGLPALGRRALTNVVAPGVASETAGQAFAGTAAEPYARIAAAMAGGLAPSIAARAITPLPATAARQGLVDTLRNEGVTSLTAGQRTGSPALRYAESELGNTLGTGGAANRVARQGQEQFTDAALRRAGTAGEATPEVLAANQRRLGNAFETLSARNTLRVDPQFSNDIRTVFNDYGRTLPSEQRQRVFNVIGDLAERSAPAPAGGVFANLAQMGTIPGDVYQTTRSRLSRIANSNRVTDPEFSGAIRGVRNALDEAMSRSIAPADQQAWEAARREYGAQKVIEKTASRAGEATAEGQLVPANLRNTVAGENRGAYARGEGQFADLSRAGAGVMAPMPQSGTAPRLAMHSIASLLGAALGTAAGPGVGTVAGAVAGPAIAGRALMSRPVQGYLGNQALTGAMRNLTPGQSAVIAALMEAEQQRLGSDYPTPAPTR